jgi:hypothetical protein
MAATESDYSGIYESAQSPAVHLKDQWPDLVRAVQALAAFYVGKNTSGTEPADALHGLAFALTGQSTNHLDWRINTDTADLLIQENTGTDASPVWATRLTIGAGGFTVPTHASTHEVAGADLVDHDNLTNFVADEHVAHSGVTLTAGNGLSGGGTIDASRSFALDLSELSTATPAAADLLCFEDVTDNSSKKATVANVEGAFSSNIVKYDTAGEFSKTQGSTEVTTGSSAGTLTLDFSATNYHQITLTENVTTLTINNHTVPAAHTIILKQAAAASYTLPASWDAGNVVWEGATAPTMPTGFDDEIIIVIMVKSDGSMRGTFSDTFTV